MPELSREERIAKALAMSKTEEIVQEEIVQEENPKTLSREERIAKALELSQAEDKKKSQSQSVSSTEESSSGTSATKKEQSSGTTKPLSLEERKALARGQKLGQLEEKKQESKLALERKQKSTNINLDVDKETEQAFKGVATKEEKMAQAKQEAMSVGETYVPNIEEKARAKEIQEAKPEQDLQRRLNLIPKEDLKSIFEGDNELTMYDGGQRLAEKYKLTEEEVDKAKAKYLDETVKEFKRKDLESSLDLIGKYAPAPKDFKDVTAYTQNIELLNKAKEMNFEKNKNLSFSLMGLEDNDRKVVDEYSSVMDRLNAYKEKSFMQQKQGADETGKGSMVINPKEIAQFEKDLKESQRLSKEIDKIRGNNNKLFDQYANIINKETGKEVTQESFTSKYENDYMKLKGALTDATYKLNYLTKEARRIRDTAQKAARGQTPKENEALSNLDRERNLAKAEVLALSNALFLNEDITKKAIKPDETKIEKTLNVFRDLSQGYSDAILGEFNMTSTSEKNQARMLNEKLKEVGINLKDADKELAPTFSEKIGGVLGTSTILGAEIAGTSILTGGAGTLARGAGMLPKVFAMYDKGGKFKKIADVIISGVNFELASEETSFAMGSAEEAAQLVFNKVTGKLKPLNPIINFFTKSLVGATGITVEEYAGDLFDNFTKTGISQETLDATFGKSKEEGLEKFALTFTMGMMSMGKNAKVLLVGSYKKAKEVNPNSETVKAMESVMSEMGVDPDDVVAQLKAEAQTKSDRLYPDGKGGQLSASNMTVEQEIVLREKLGYKPLTEEELDIKRTVQEQEELAPADSPYVTKKEMDDDLKVLKGEDEGTLPETYVGESVRTEEGIVTTVTEKVEEGTQLRVPTEQLVTDEAKPVAETFDRKKAGVIDVWQDTETNELFVINGTKRVATAMEDGVASVDVNFVKANDLQEAYKIGDLKNKLEDTDKTIDAVDLVKANPTLKENLDLSKPKEAELYGLASLNESLTEELKSNPNQAGVLSIIGNNVSTEKQSEVYQFAKDNNLGKDEVAQLVKEPDLLNKIKTKGVTEEKVSVQPKNIKDLYNVNRKLFGLDKLKSLSSAVVMDRMIGVMAKRAKITKEQMYGRLKFEKASEKDLPKGVKMQVEAWHGSPYQFDKFTTKAMGTGEGVQAFGWGLYFTELESIGRGYANELAREVDLEIDGKKVKSETLKGWVSMIQSYYSGQDLKIEDFTDGLINKGLDYGYITKEDFDLIKNAKDIKVIKLKNLYKVTIHKGKSPDEYNWLDWYGKPNKEQVKNIFSKLTKEQYDNGFYYGLKPDATNADLYKGLVQALGSQEKASMFLLENGIDGIKYPAESISRGATSDTARGFNYVVFDENAVSIEETIRFQKAQNKAQGAAMVANDGKAIIYALTDPNVTTPLHELAHVYEHYLTDAERKTIQEFAGTTEWTTETSEVFARGFEKYLAEGVAPNSILQKVFEKFKEWLIDIYNGIKGSDIDIELNKPMRDIYAQMVGADNSLIKAEVEIKTELSKTGQSNIDALSKDATQLGLEPETLYDRVLANSPTVKALTEKYAKGVASGLYSTTEATNRLNAEIKENLDAIKKEAGLDEAKKEVAQLESALTSDKKTSSDVLRDIASKIDKIADKMSNNTYSTIFGVEPLIAKAFLKTLSATLKTSATFMDGFNKAIAKFKNSDILKGKTAQEINDIVAQLTKATTDIKQIADLKNPITKLQQSKVKQTVEARIKYLYQNSMNTLPTQNSIEKIAEKSGIIDYKTFAENVYRRLNKLEQSRAKRMEKFEGAVSDFITKGGGSIKSLFNQLSTLILKDKEQAVILKNAFINAMGKQNVKGVKFTPQHIIQITKAFESSKLNTLSGIYDLTQKLDYIVNKAVDVTLNNKVTQLQEEIKRKSKSLKNTKQNEYIKSLLDLTPSKILNEELKIDLVKTLEDVKEYLSGKDNLNYDENTSQDKLEEWQNEIKKYEEEKERELINAMYEQYKLDNPGASITEDEYKQFIYPNEKELEEQKEAEEKAIKSDERKTKKREKLETLTLFNIQEILKNTLKFTDYFTIEIVKELQETLKFFVDGDHIKDLSSEQLIKINRLYTEMISFNSASQAGIINSELTGLKNAIVNQSKMMDKLRTFNNRLKNFLFNPDGSPIFGKGNELVGFHRLIERMFLGQEADTIGSIMFKKLFFGINKAKKEYEVYAKALNKLAKFNLKNKDNYNLGVKAYLLSSPKGATEMEAQLLFELKKEKIRLDINRLIEKSKVTSGVSSGTKKAAAQRAELYQEALNDINQYDTYKEYLDAYNSGNLLTKEQTEVYELTKSEYAKIKPELIASNIAYGDKEFVEEDNYTSISYLRMDTGKSDKDVLDPSFTAQAGILDAQSGTVFSRVKNPTNVKEVLDFDFYNVSRRRVLESYTDVFTRGARLELSSFMDSKQFREVFKNNDDLYNVFKERVGRYANSVLANKRTNLNVDKKAVKILKNLVTNVKLAYLARTGQLLKQLSIINHSLARLDLDFIRGLGVYYGNVFTPEGRAKINELMEGSDSINRKALGDEQFAEAIGRLNTAVLTDNYSSLRKINHYVNKFMLDIGNSILSFPDLGLNNATYIGAMIQEQRKQRKGGDSSKLKGIGIDTLIHNKDTENTYKADRITGFINNESDTGKQGGMFVNQGLGAQLFYQFKSMAVNAAVGAQNAVLDLTDPKATVKDREIALRNLIGYVGSIVAFHISKELLKDLWDDNLKEGAKKITGRKLEREEDRRKSIIDNLNSKTVWSEYAYRIMLRSATDVFAGGVMPSNASDAFGVGAEFVTKPLYKTVMNKEYEGDPIFWGNWKELSGSFSYLFDLVESGTDVVSPYVHTAEQKRGMNNMAIIESMYDAGKSRPLETTADILYFLSLRYGKGVPSEFLSAIKKVIKNNYKADDNKYERLNPFQKAKQDK